MVVSLLYQNQCMAFHLAQANIAQFKAPLDDPIMKEFVDFIEPVNKLAEESPGFVWRLTDDAGRSSSYITTDIFNASMAVNLSIWEDIPLTTVSISYRTQLFFTKQKKVVQLIWTLKSGALVDTPRRTTYLRFSQREVSSLRPTRS